jgi:hypothetical protein
VVYADELDYGCFILMSKLPFRTVCIKGNENRNHSENFVTPESISGEYFHFKGYNCGKKKRTREKEVGEKFS